MPFYAAAHLQKLKKLQILHWMETKNYLQPNKPELGLVGKFSDWWVPLKIMDNWNSK